MFVIALASIPPRFGQLPYVLEGLLDQGADRIAVTIPRRFARFESTPLPQLPCGVDLIETENDLGPAGKLLAPACRWPEADILYCDDDWDYRRGWAEAFRAARATQSPDAVIAASTWRTERIGRKGGTIVQGFAGALVAARHAAAIPAPANAAWTVDDIWLSGHFAHLGLEIHEAPQARGHMRPLASPGALQETTRRDEANCAAAALIARMYGIWPER